MEGASCHETGKSHADEYVHDERHERYDDVPYVSVRKKSDIDFHLYGL